MDSNSKMKLCPFCNMFKCDHCRCIGYPGCAHKSVY